MKTSPSEKTQLEKFKEAARELECDDDEQRFKERLGKLVKSSPVDKSKK
ncbi:hypothetical protein [Tsuneonella amylolytica]|nr:hypothetical protein [Tsuneonella amylolytica]